MAPDSWIGVVSVVPELERRNEAYPILHSLDDLRRLNWISHRRRGKVGDPTQEVGVKLVVVHVLSNPGLDDVRNSAGEQRISCDPSSKAETDAPCLNRSLLSSLPGLHLLRIESRRRLDEEASDEKVEELMRGAEGAISHEECRKVVAVDCEWDKWSVKAEQKGKTNPPRPS